MKPFALLDVVSAENNLLDLFEQVNAEQTVSVLSRGAGLATEAEAGGAQFDRQISLVQDLTGVNRRQRNLCSADQRELIPLAKISLIPPRGNGIRLTPSYVMSSGGATPAASRTVGATSMCAAMRSIFAGVFTRRGHCKKLKARIPPS